MTDLAERVDADTARLIEEAERATGRDGDAMAAVWRAAVAAGNVSAELAAPLMDRLWFTVWQGDPGDRVREREARWMAPLTATNEVIAGHRVTTYAGGSGPAVLLVHGWGDYAARLGAFVAPLLDAGLRVLAVDLPAHGSSAAHTTNLYELRDVVRALIETHDVKVLVGHSMGAMTSVYAAHALAGDRPALALLAPPMRMEDALDTFARMFQLPPAAIDGLRQTIEGRFGESVWAELRAEGVARELDVPALVIHDVDDDQVPVADGRQMAASLPRAELVTTSGLGHAKVIRDDAVVRRVVAFARANV